MQDNNKNLFTILSFFGAAIAIFFAFVNGGSAGDLIKAGYGFNGVCSIFSALGWAAVAVLVYRNYQKKDSESKKK